MKAQTKGNQVRKKPMSSHNKTRETYSSDSESELTEAEERPVKKIARIKHIKRRPTDDSSSGSDDDRSKRAKISNRRRACKTDLDSEHSSEQSEVQSDDSQPLDCDLLCRYLKTHHNWETLYE